MFLKGLHYKMREQLAVINPNPDSLNKLYTDVIQIENLSKRTNLVEFYYNQQRVRNSQQNNNHNQRNSSRRDDPMDVDLFRIKNDIEDTPRTIIKIYMLKIKETFLKKRKKVYVFCVNNQDTCNSIVLTEKDLLELNTRIKLEKQMKIFHQQN